MYAKIETESLNFSRFNQTKLRAEDYLSLRDAVARYGNGNNAGKLVVLPSSFTGGPRYMHERIQDAMTYVRHYGGADLFITFTCKPNWKDIQDAIYEYQKAQDRYDIVTRVFRLKVEKLLQVIVKNKILGPVKCYMTVIEWQKRGLPHVHPENRCE